MTLPSIHELNDDEGWVRILAGPSVGLFVVYSPSAEAHVARLFPGVRAENRWRINREPHLEDFSRFERQPECLPELVVGIGGGRALDAAKVVAHWGRGYRTVGELQRVLQAGGRLGMPDRARLILAPSVASSGSESSKGAIITADSMKSGLRGDSLQPDGVIHDTRLWAGMQSARRRHYAFDVFAHLLETTVSLRRTPVAVAHATTGAGELRHWLVGSDDSPEAYRAAMRAAYHAGVCLANSGTCLPHRIQYVLGPATGTNHVEGIWMLSPAWVERVVTAVPERAQEVACLLDGEKWGQATLAGLVHAIHARTGHGVRREYFRCTRAQAMTLARRVSGDLSADPAYVDLSTIEQLLLPFIHDR